MHNQTKFAQQHAPMSKSKNFTTSDEQKENAAGSKTKTEKLKKPNDDDPVQVYEREIEMYNRKTYKNVTEALEMFKNDELLAEPGTKYNYTTHGYTLLSAVAETVAGRPFTALLLELFETLGMHRTMLDENPVIVANRTQYYQRTKHGHQLENVPEVDCSYKWAGGGILSCVEDLLVFANAMLSAYQRSGCTDTQATNTTSNPKPSFLSSSTVSQMWSPHVSYELKQKHKGTVKKWYGLGWNVVSSKAATQKLYPQQPWAKDAFVSHTGGALGASSVLLIRPVEANCGPKHTDSEAGIQKSGPRGICIAILANLEGVNLTSLAVEIVNAFDSVA